MSHHGENNDRSIIDLNPFKHPDDVFEQITESMDNEEELHKIWRTHTSNEEVKLLLCLMGFTTQEAIKGWIDPKAPEDDQMDLLPRTVKANETHFPGLSQHVLVMDGNYEFDFAYELLFIHIVVDCWKFPEGYYENLVL